MADTAISVNVQCYGELKKLCGGPSQQLELAPDARTIKDVITLLGERYPQARAALARSVCAVGDTLVSADRVVQPNAEIALIPPVSGG